MKRFCLTFLAGVLLTGASPSHFLPPKTIAVLTVPNANTLRAAWEQTALANLWTDPAMSKFTAEFDRGLRHDFLSLVDIDLKEILGLDLSGLVNLGRGQVTVAITDNRGAPGEFDPTVLLLVDTIRRAKALTDLLDRIRANLNKTKHPFEIRNVHDVNFIEFELELGGFKSRVLLGHAGDLLVAGNRLADIERVLDTLAGKRMPSLFTQKQFTIRDLAQFKNAAIWGWLDFTAIARLIQQSLKPDPDDVPDPLGLNPERIVKAIGLTSLKSVGLSLHLNGDGVMGEVYLEQPATDRHGLFQMLATPSADASPPPFIANNVRSYTRWRRDWQKLWGHLEGILVTISPAVKGGLEFLEGTVKASEPNFDFRRQIIGNLGGDYLVIGLPIREEKPNDIAPELYLLESTRPALTLAALRAILSAVSQMPPQKQIVEGRTIYSYKLGDGFEETDKVDVHFATSAGYIVWTTRREALEAYLRGPDPNAGLKQLRRDPALRTAAAKVGGMNNGWFGYDNTRENMREFFRVARAEPEAAAVFPFEAIFSEGDFTMPTWLNYSLLPPFKQVERYFGITVFGVTTDDHGLRLRIFEPVPAPR